MNQPRTVQVAIVGGGLGALVTYAVLRFRGLARHDIVVVSADNSPEKSWAAFARAIKLKHLRSESTGHLFPTDSPGLATVQALKTWSLVPIIRSWFDRYHPTLEFFLEHVHAIARRTGFLESLVVARVERLERTGNHFTLSGQDGHPLAFAQHVVLAVGHGPERVPETVANFREQHPGDNRVALAYELKTYQSRTVLVIGDGITAATEWANVLKAGGAVAAVSHSNFTLNQPLQVPRRYFSRRGLSPYRNRSQAERLHELKTATRGTIPPASDWNKRFMAAEQEERLSLVKGNVAAIRVSDSGRLACAIEFTDERITHTVEVDQVISATGFWPASSHPLLARLIQDHDLPVHDGVLELTDDSCLEKLSRPGSAVAVVGPAAAWAVPCADSLVGMKISARAFTPRLAGKSRFSLRRLTQQTADWARLVANHQLV